MSRSALIIIIILAITASLSIFTFESTNFVNFLPLEPRRPAVDFPLADNKPLVLPETTIVTPVLMYHYVRNIDQNTDPLGYGLSVTPEDFTKQLRYLKDNDYQTVTPDELYAAIKNSSASALPKKPVLLTFDDGYKDFYTAAFPILKQFNFKASVFVITGSVSDQGGRYLTWDQLKELDNSGLVTIGSHTITHKDLVTRPEALPEIKDSKDILEKFLGHPVTSFVYPGGAYDQTVVNLVNQDRYNIAFTTRYGIWHNYSSRLETSRVRVSGGLPMEKFVERITGKFSLP